MPSFWNEAGIRVSADLSSTSSVGAVAGFCLHRRAASQQTVQLALEQRITVICNREIKNKEIFQECLPLNLHPPASLVPYRNSIAFLSVPSLLLLKSTEDSKWQELGMMWLVPPQSLLWGLFPERGWCDRPNHSVHKQGLPGSLERVQATTGTFQLMPRALLCHFFNHEYLLCNSSYFAANFF